MSSDKKFCLSIEGFMLSDGYEREIIYVPIDELESILDSAHMNAIKNAVSIYQHQLNNAGEEHEL